MIIEDRNRLPEAIRDIPPEKLALAARDHYHDEPFTTEPIGFYRDAMRRLCHNRVSMVSLSAILLIVILAIGIVLTILGIIAIVTAGAYTISVSN